jgi:hypothetical protein
MSDLDRKKVADYVISYDTGLYDEKGGVDISSCPLCKSSVCLGHLGLLDLKGFYINPLFNTKYNNNLRLLCSVCDIYCSSPLKQCSRCGKYSRYPPDTVIMGSKFPHLEKYLMQYILIPPSSVRSREADEWKTELYSLYKKLLYHVQQQNASSIKKYLSRIFGVEKGDSLISFLSNKNGIIRKICYGKRIENSARSVITGDPYISVDEVHIPRELADVLCIKYTLTEADSDPSKFFLLKDFQMEKWQMIPGVTVWKKLEDGDLVFLNRQPTLSYQSILSFKAKIRQDDIRTIGIHPSVTKTFNADFDGDEMNIYVFPQSEDCKRCLITNFPECINSIQDEKSFKYLKLESYRDLDMYGLSVSLDDLTEKAYENTAFKIMAESGAKGSLKNYEQMALEVGDQYVFGKKIGTIRNSYCKGLDVDEYIMQQMAAREGIVIQGVSTSDTGYINRKGCHLFADVVRDERIIKDDFGYIDFF